MGGLKRETQVTCQIQKWVCSKDSFIIWWQYKRAKDLDCIWILPVGPLLFLLMSFTLICLFSLKGKQHFRSLWTWKSLCWSVCVCGDYRDTVTSLITVHLMSAAWYKQPQLVKGISQAGWVASVSYGLYVSIRIGGSCRVTTFFSGCFSHLRDPWSAHDMAYL